MPVTVEQPRAHTETYYKCAFCDFTSWHRDTCAEHEWTKHTMANAGVHYETAWGVDLKFWHFAERETFDGFTSAFCARTPKWEGPGWYREYTYRDYCRGCDMGETTGLEKVDDSDCAEWIDGGMRDRAAALPILFGLPLDHPIKFEHDGAWWRLRRHHLPDESMSIEFAVPEHAEVSRDALVEAWKVWRADR
jgi:hypothetical protein